MMRWYFYFYNNILSWDQGHLSVNLFNRFLYKIIIFIYFINARILVNKLNTRESKNNHL